MLVVAPFPPRLDGRHGGARALVQSLARLARQNTVALLVLKSGDEQGVDESLRGACDLVEEIEIMPSTASFRSRLLNGIRLRVALLRGTPTWASHQRVVELNARLDALAREWRPELVQLEYRIMGQCLAALEGSSAPAFSSTTIPREHRAGWPARVP